VVVWGDRSIAGGRKGGRLDDSRGYCGPKEEWKLVKEAWRRCAL